MTDKPYTPTTARIKDDYRRSRVWESGNGSEAYEKEFDRWFAAVEAAAEQRGKEQAWDEGYQDGYNDGLSDGHNLDNMRDPNENPYRADQMEGDDGQS